MAISNRHSSLVRPHVIITENRFLIHSMEKGIWKLQKTFERDPIVGSKVMTLSKCPPSLLRPDLIIIENRFLIHSMEKGIRKL
jgi:hypothetical protein